MGTTTNVTSLLSPTISALTLKGALFLNRKLRIEEEEAGQYGKICNFSPLDSEQSAYSWETTVRSSSGANPSGRPSCSGSLPDFLHHHTRDDLGHSVHREDRERMSPRADPKVPPSVPDSLQELLSNCQQTGMQPTVPTGVPTLHGDRVQQSAKD